MSISSIIINRYSFFEHTAMIFLNVPQRTRRLIQCVEAHHTDSIAAFTLVAVRFFTKQGVRSNLLAQAAWEIREFRSQPENRRLGTGEIRLLDVQ